MTSILVQLGCRRCKEVNRKNLRPTGGTVVRDNMTFHKASRVSIAHFLGSDELNMVMITLDN